MSDTSVNITEPSERARDIIYGRYSPYETMTEMQINQINLTAMNYGLIAEQNPYLTRNPAALQEFASGIDPITAATEGAVMFAQQDLNSMVNVWTDMDDATQRSTWGQLSDLQQRALLHAGIKNPYTDPDKAWWEDAIGVGTDVVGILMGGVGKAITKLPYGDKALDALIWIGNEPFHLYRTIRQLDSWQQWIAVAGAVGGVAAGAALAPFTGGGSLLAAGTIAAGALAGASITGAATNPTEFVDAYKTSFDGERVFTNKAQERALDLLQAPELFALAKDIAYEMSPYDLAVEMAAVRGSTDPMTMMSSVSRIADRMAVPGTQQHQIISQGIVNLLGTPEFMQAIKVLENGKISIGRDVANAMGLEQGGAAHTLLSGSIDAFSMFVLDPFLMASPYLKAARFGRYSMESLRPAWFRYSMTGKPVTGITTDVVARRIALSNNSRAVRAMDEQIARAITTNTFRLMPKNMRALWEPIRNHLQATGVLDEAFQLRPGQVFEREDLLQWMTEVDQLQHIARGVGTVRGIQGTAVLKPMSDVGVVGTLRKNFRDFRDNLVDPTALQRLEKQIAKTGAELGVIIPPSALDEGIHPQLVPTSELSPTVVDSVGGGLGRVVAWVPGAGPTLGKVLDTLSNMTPRSGHLVLEGAQAAEDIPRFINAFGRVANLPQAVRQQWIDAVMAQQGAAARNQMIMSFYDSLFEITGLKGTRAGEKMAKQFKHRWEQNYAIGQIDRMKDSTGRFLTSRGVLTIDQAVAVQMGEVREMIVAARHASIVGDILGIVPSDQMISFFMSRMWKPSVVLRLGFVLRAAGEEALAMVARGTDGMLGAEFGARRLAQRQLYDEALALQQTGQVLSPVHRKALEWELPAVARQVQRVSSRLPVAGNVIESGLLQFEKFLRRVLDPQAFDPNAGVLRRGLAEAIDKQHPIVQALLVGKRHSWRNTAMRGVRRDLQDSAFAWYTRHADSTMRLASSGHASLYDDYVNNERVLAVEMNEDGTFIETVHDRGTREIVDKDHERYQYGIHEGAERPFADPNMGPALEEAMYLYLPTEFGLDETLVRALDEAIADANPAAVNLLLEFTKMRRDRLLSLRSQIGSYVPSGNQALLDDLIKLVDDIIDADAVEDWTRVFDVLAKFEREGAVVAAHRTFIDSARQLVDQSIAGKNTADTMAWLQYRVGFNVRNPGRAATLRQGRYVTDFEDYYLTVRQIALSEAMKPENFERTAQSQRVLGSRSGDARVINPQSPNMRRVYSPDLNGTNKIAQDVEYYRNMGMTDPKAVADTLAQQYVTSARGIGVDPEIARFGEAFLVESLSVALEQMITEGLLGMPFTALGGVSYGNPLLARWVSDVLSDTMFDDAVSILHYKDIGRQTLSKVGDQFEGTEYLIDNGGGVYINDTQGRSGLEPMQGTVLPDGTFGIDQADAIEEFMDLGTQSTVSVHAKNIDVQYEPVAGYTVYSDKAAMQPATQKTFREGDVVFDKDGKPVTFRDNENFNAGTTTARELNWKLVGPMALDSIDRKTRNVRKGVRTVKRMEPRRIRKGVRETTVYDDAMPLTWSRVDDVLQGDTASHAVATVYIPREGMLLDRIFQYGFESVITPSVDALVRHPLAFHNFTMARLQNQRMLGAFVSPAAREGIAGAIPPTPEARKLLDDYVGEGFMGTDLEYVSAHYSYVRTELHPIAMDQNAPLFATLNDMSRAEFNKLVDPALRIADDATYKKFQQGFASFDNWMNDIETNASIYAINNLEPFLDSSQFKSEFSQYTKNLMPFWYAEENFIKRWMRGAYLSGTFGLDQLRKGQLTYMGLQSAGIVQTDVNGTDWFVYPGSGLVQELVSKIVPGAGELPVGTLFGSTTTSMLPGFNAEAGRPGIGPFGAIPLGFLSTMFPEFKELERNVLGDVGTGRGVVAQLFPASIRRFVEATFGNENTSTRYGAAMNAAIAMMEAEGNGLPDSATPLQLQEYLDRVREHARIVMTTQAVLGFVTPGTPIAMTTGEDAYTWSWLSGTNVDDPSKVFKRTYFFYLQTFGYEEGVRRYLAENPFANIDDIVNPEAFQVSRTEATTGKAIPTTEVAMQWYNENKTWVDQSPLAAPWFAPIDDGVEDFSLYAYNEAFNNGLRRLVPPEEVLRSHLVTRAASEYYYRKKEFDDRELSVASNPRLLAQAQAEKQQWQTNFFAANPVFEAHLQTSDSSLQRQDTIRQIRRVLDDPATPMGQHNLALREMIEAYDLHRGRLGELNLRGRSARVLELVRNEKKNFGAWAQNWINRNPLTASFYTTVIEPELI